MKINFNVEEGINHIIVPVYVNDKGPFNFTLDTGAQTTTLSSTLVDKLELKTIELEGEKYKILKESRNLKKSLVNLRIGTEEIVNEEIWVMDLNFATKKEEKKVLHSTQLKTKKVVQLTEPKKKTQLYPLEPKMKKIIHKTDGVIGYSILKNYSLSVNYRTRIMQLERSNSEFTNKHKDKMQKFEYIEDTHLIGVPVLVNNEGPFTFVLDTGAGGTTITNHLADKLKLPLSGIVARALGIHGVQETHVAIIENISISSNTYEDIHAVIIDESLIGPRGELIKNGILGYPIFKEYELIIDYPNQSYALI